MAWVKLDQYYTKLTDTAVPYVACALHPSYRWRLFEGIWADDDQQAWVDEAKHMVKDVWEKHYKSRDLEGASLSSKGQAPGRSSISFINWRNKVCLGSSNNIASETSSSTSAGDEYERWMDTPQAEDEISDPFAYWQSRLHVFPRLARMALDFLTISPMSAELERTFSVAGRMVTAGRWSLSAETISMCMAMRSWHRAGIVTPDERILVV